MRHFFKVKYGFGSLDYVVIDNGRDLERAVYAKVEKIPNVILGGKLLDGKFIISIEPDVHSYLGWNRGYEPQNSSDFAEIRQKVPQEAFELLEVHYRHIGSLIENGQEQRVGMGEAKNLLVSKNSQ